MATYKSFLKSFFFIMAPQCKCLCDIARIQAQCFYFKGESTNNGYSVNDFIFKLTLFPLLFIFVNMNHAQHCRLHIGGFLHPESLKNVCLAQHKICLDFFPVGRDLWLESLIVGPTSALSPAAQ